MVKIVNMVGSGRVPVEIALGQLSTDITDFEVRYDPEEYPGLYMRFEEGNPLVTLYRSGRFNITGGKSKSELDETLQRLVEFLSELEIIGPDEDVDFSIRNVVCTVDSGYELHLSALAASLGLEKTEYEPEQFPALVYRPENHGVVFLIFSTGKIVVTGAQSQESAEKAYKDLLDQIDSLPGI